MDRVVAEIGTTAAHLAEKLGRLEVADAEDEAELAVPATGGEGRGGAHVAPWAAA